MSLRDQIPFTHHFPLMPYRSGGWGDGDGTIARTLKGDELLIIEVGSWLGASARDIAKRCPEAQIICVDTWLGSADMPADGGLFDNFLSNIYHDGLQDRVFPVRMDSVNAAYKLLKMDVVADAIYIDGGHEYETVKQDLSLYKRLLKVGGVMILDDQHYFPIQRAAIEELPGARYEASKIIWVKP